MAIITLAQGLCSDERMKQLVVQATELGVDRIIPTVTSRCKFNYTQKEKDQRVADWNALSRKTAFSLDIRPKTEVLPIANFRDVIALAKEDADVSIIPWEGSMMSSMHKALQGVGFGSSVYIFIGPEDGLSATDVELAHTIKAKMVKLGETIMNTETAGVIASALAIYELGGLGNVEANIAQQIDSSKAETKLPGAPYAR